MTKAALAALVAVLLCGVGIAGAAGPGKTRYVTKLCANVETKTDFPSYGDLNLYRGDLRVCLKAKRGAKGAKGARGKRGQDGAPGADGLAGPQGAVGPQGREGVGYDCAGFQVRSPGEAHECHGATGPQGPQGEAGPQGPAGATGPEGPAGPTGPQGPQGEPGGLGNGLAWLCINDSGDSMKWGGFGDEADCTGMPGHPLTVRIVILQQEGA